METLASLLAKNMEPSFDYEVIFKVPFVNHSGDVDYKIVSKGLYEKEDAKRRLRTFWGNKKVPNYLQKTWDCSSKTFEQIKEMFFAERKWGNPAKIIKNPLVRRYFTEMEISRTHHR